jgi:hypothetical protein
MPCLSSPVVGTPVPSASTKARSPSRSPPRRVHNLGRTALIASIRSTMSASEKRRRKSPGRGRVGQQPGAEPVHQRHVVAEPVDILQPGPTGQHAVGQGEHMVGLVIRQVHLQQAHPIVDLCDQPEPGDQAVHREQPAERGRFTTAADLVVNLPRSEHRRRLRTPSPRQPVPSLHPTPTACRVTPALLMRYLLHHKGLILLDALRALSLARSGLSPPKRRIYATDTLTEGLEHRARLARPGHTRPPSAACSRR